MEINEESDLIVIQIRAKELADAALLSFQDLNCDWYIREYERCASSLREAMAKVDGGGDGVE